MTIILISTKTLIKKKKRESWGERIVSKLSGIYLELFKCIWKWSYPVQKKCRNFKLKTSGWCTTTLAPTLILTGPSVQILKKPGTTNCSELAITRVIQVEKNHLDFSPKKKNPYSIEFCFALTRNTEGNLNKN